MAFSRIASVALAAVGAYASADFDDSALVLVQSKATVLSHDNHDKCMKPAGLLFMHVMKNGGTSVDEYLACRCNQVSAGMQLSLGDLSLYHGKQDCKDPTVCSTHGDYKDRKELCGRKFEQPDKVFTVMREPVERAFSMYNYEKAEKYARTKQVMPPLAEMIKDCKNNCTAGKGTEFMCQSLMNHMTLQTFATKDNHYSVKDNEASVNQAKETLAKMDAIFYMDNFDTFASDFDKSQLLSREGVDASKCELSHSNPTECTVCNDKPTQEELELLTEVNAMDTKLYEWANTQPNYNSR